MSRVMRLWPLGLLMAVSACDAPSGGFCAVYTPVLMTAAGATALVPADRPAAERVAVNEETAKRCQ